MSDPNQDSNSAPTKTKVWSFPDGVAPQESTEVLKSLFDKIVHDMAIGKNRWGNLATDYIKKRARETGMGDNVNLVEERSSLNKNFVTQTKMTWKSLCRGMQLLRARRFRIGLTIEHASGRMTDHGMWVVVDNMLTFDPELDEDIAIPVEVEIPSNGGAQPPVGRAHVPPPDLDRYAGRYPATRT